MIFFQGFDIHQVQEQEQTRIIHKTSETSVQIFIHKLLKGSLISYISSHYSVQQTYKVLSVYPVYDSKAIHKA